MRTSSTFEVPARTQGPRFDQLPRLGETDLRHAWEVFGEGDELGTLNRITPEVVQAAVGLVRTGERISLDLPITLPNPPKFGRNPVRHSVYELDRNTWDDKLDDFQLQTTSQWDGLRHVRAREFGFYGGWQGPPEAGDSRLGIDRYADHGIISRGVLVDLSSPNSDPFESRAFSAEELAAAVDEQCGELREGDILCIRFGWVDRYLTLSYVERVALEERDARVTDRQWAGLAGSEAMARYLWDQGLAAVVADNPALEVAPGDRTVGDLHRRILPTLGFAIGELFSLTELASVCHREGRRDFLFVGVPLKVPGGVGSPANAMAVL